MCSLSTWKVVCLFLQAGTRGLSMKHTCPCIWASRSHDEAHLSLAETPVLVVCRPTAVEVGAVHMASSFSRVGMEGSLLGHTCRWQRRLCWWCVGHPQRW